MRLSRLIHDQKESILQDFEEFARTHTSSGTAMDIAALRDHAAGILDAFARDLEQPQSEAERDRKSKGDAARTEPMEVTAAQEHGVARAHSGFTLDEAIAEYRALRASVMRHWTKAGTASPHVELEDIIRFNEAIDQAITESMHEYAKEVTRYREMFLAVLGHDLRSPLNAIINASTFLVDTQELSDRDQRLARVIQSSVARMMDLIDDLLDLTYAQLGKGIRLRPQSTDLGQIAEEAIGNSEVMHPDREFRLTLGGDLKGEWDLRRIQQALSNLLDNAVKHGAPDSPITVTVSDARADGVVVVAVHNLGPAIPADEQAWIFHPFRRGSSHSADAEGPRRGMGLGLYIARQIAEAHGGCLEVESVMDQGTTFYLRLPRPAED